MTKFVCFFFVRVFMRLPVFYCLLLGFRFVLLKYIEKGGWVRGFNSQDESPR